MSYYNLAIGAQRKVLYKNWEEKVRAKGNKKKDSEKTVKQEAPKIYRPTQTTTVLSNLTYVTIQEQWSLLKASNLQRKFRKVHYG